MTIKDVEKIIEYIRSIFNAPVVKILLVFGIIFMLISFIDFDGLRKITLNAWPKWGILIVGFILTCAGIAVFLLAPEEKRINKKASIEKGLSLRLSQTLVNLKIGNIQEISNGDKTTAVVLPANTSFIDDCITDRHSALGAFMLEHFPDKVSEITKVMGETLERLKVPKNNNEMYPAGTTIILPPPYDSKIKILITATTIREKKVGIKAEPSSICECIRQVFMVTADKKISKLYMPVLGSGHGGLDINAALLFLLLSIKYYASRFHHIKAVELIITKNDAKRVRDIYRLQYLTLLEERTP